MEETIGMLLRIARERQRMSVTDLSLKTGIPLSTIYKYERNEIEPSFKNVAAIADELKLDLNQLGRMSR